MTEMKVAAGAVIAVPMHLISVTDLPEIDRDGKMMKKSSSAVDIARVDAKDTVVQTASAV